MLGIGLLLAALCLQILSGLSTLSFWSVSYICHRLELVILLAKWLLLRNLFSVIKEFLISIIFNFYWQDFFTEDHWTRLPHRWAHTFDQLTPRQLGSFLFEEGSCHIVAPLSLLSLRAFSRGTSLNRRHITDLSPVKNLIPAQPSLQVGCTYRFRYYSRTNYIILSNERTKTATLARCLRNVLRQRSSTKYLAWLPLAPYYPKAPAVTI